MNKKGFTLIELLGVIIILSLITFLVLPNISSAVRSKQEDVDKVNKKLIYAATELYLKDIYDMEEIKLNNKYCVKIQTLKEKGYLKEAKNPYTNELLDNKVVFVKYDDGFDFTLYDSLDDCNNVIN